MDHRVIVSSVLGGLIGSFATMAGYCFWKHVASPKKKSVIQRLKTKDPRASAIVVHNGVVYISGQVGEIEKLAESDVTAQTEQTLAKIETLLADVGIDKSRILEARIWLKDIKTDFAAMNAVWNAWVDPANKGVRYCVESHLARPALLVEIQVVAAL